MTGGQARIPSLIPYLLVCAVTALCVPVGRFEREMTADSVIMLLVSLQRWTPFYWGQDRIGMFVPLLAMPFHSPFANLLFQHAVCVFAALAAMLLLPRYLLRNAAYPVVGLVSAAAFLAFAPATFCFDFTVNTFYGVWLAAGLGALVLMENGLSGSMQGWRMLGALLLLVVAHWEYTGTALVLGPVVVFRHLLCRNEEAWVHQEHARESPTRTQTIIRRVLQVLRGETSISLLLLGLGLIAGLGLMRCAREVYPYGRTVVGFERRSHWLRMWRQLAVNAWQALAPHSWPWFLLGALAVGLVLLAVPAVRRQRSWRAAGAVVLGATAYFLFMGTQRWTSMNGCFYRYCHPVVFLLQGAVLVFAVGPVIANLTERLRRGSALVAATGLLIAALATYHPSLRASHVALERSMGQCTEDILAARCTHVAGNYWKVWPAVYHANLALSERHEKRVVWGITGRSELTRKYWQNVPPDEWRIAVPVDVGPNAEAVAGHFGFPPASECGAYPRLPGQTERALAYFQLPPLVVVEKRRTIWVLARQTTMDRYGLILAYFPQTSW